MDRLDKFLLKELLEIGKQLGLAIKAGIKKNELKELIEKDIESKENTDIAWNFRSFTRWIWFFKRNKCRKRYICFSFTSKKI